MRRIRLFFKIRRFIPFVISFFRSREIALRKKIAYLLLFIGYFFIPFDAIPDWLAVIGMLDDVAVLMLILKSMIKTAPNTLKHKYGI